MPYRGYALPNYIQPPGLLDGIPQIFGQYLGYRERQDAQNRSDSRYEDAITREAARHDETTARDDASIERTQANADRSYDLQLSGQEFNQARQTEADRLSAREKTADYLAKYVLPALSHSGAATTDRLTAEAEGYIRIDKNNGKPERLAELMKPSFEQMKSEARAQGVTEDFLQKLFGDKFDYNHTADLGRKFKTIITDEQYARGATIKSITNSDGFVGALVGDDTGGVQLKTLKEGGPPKGDFSYAERTDKDGNAVPGKIDKQTGAWEPYADGFGGKPTKSGEGVSAAKQEEMNRQNGAFDRAKKELGDMTPAERKSRPNERRVDQLQKIIDKGRYGGADDPGNEAPGAPDARGWGEVIKKRDSNSTIETVLGGKKITIPTLVPTLTATEVKTLADLPPGDQIPPEIVAKAIEFAKDRVSHGLSPFNVPGKPMFEGAGPARALTGSQDAGANTPSPLATQQRGNHRAVTREEIEAVAKEKGVSYKQLRDALKLRGANIMDGYQ